MANDRKSGIQVTWTTITYRSVGIFVLLIVIAAGAGLYLLFPEQSKEFLEKTRNLLAGIGLGSNTANQGQAAGPQQAQFTAIDGSVRVKKAASNTWVNADYNVTLERGDVVQTGAEGLAKVMFADGTSYTIKQDSLIVIEESSRNESAQTNVSVQVTTGTVDLATGTFTAGSKSQVVVAGARASFAPESAAQVRNDPRNDRQEILVKQGSGSVQRGNQTVSLGNYEKVSFRSSSEQAMLKEREIRPPTLIAPANMAPLFIAGGSGAVVFTWTPVDNTRSYRVRISRNPYFSSLVMDRRVNEPELRLTGLEEGAYYWAVQAQDTTGRESPESERNRFTIIPKGSEGVALALELDSFVQHGHVIEVRGRTEPNARVMVNGQEVPVIRGDGSFNYFTPKLPSGENTITVTAQNAKGGVNTKQRKVVIR